ncbi:hypothetical protein KAOT1_19377 [Kordia algicida OT-1]|uniref:Uncharacterized protein n=1 Tax=Kordia algicida OT-1 TaxID=391587 RepID=A9DP51_9FLAO|nr:hypothetical protein KAOT1_19377 [Kordia algicida OT-1]
MAIVVGKNINNSNENGNNKQRDKKLLKKA